MAISATIPVADMAAANDALREAGHGVGNFSVPMRSGAAVTDTRNALHDAATGAAHIVEYQTVNASAWTGGRLAAWHLNNSFCLDGKIYGMVASEALTLGEIASTRAYLAAKSGVTL